MTLHISTFIHVKHLYMQRKQKDSIKIQKEKKYIDNETEVGKLPNASNYLDILRIFKSDTKQYHKTVCNM